MLDAMWLETARQLGGTLHPSTNDVVYDDFQGMREALLPAGAAPPTRFSWLSAEHRGRPVLAKMTERRHYSRRQERWITEQWTYAMAPIDPPAFLGLEIATTGGLLGSLLNPRPDVLVGHPPFDERYAVSAFSVPRVRQLLDPRACAPFLGALTALADVKLGVLITDRVARIARSGLHPHVNLLGPWIDAVARIGEEVEAHRARLPEVPGELPVEAYAAAAHALGLAFDRPRMRAAGRVRSTPVRLSLEVRAKTVRTELRAAFPRALGMGLSLARQGTEGIEAELSRALFGGGEADDLRVGDPAFDGSFVVRGQPPERVRAFLAHPEARGRLLLLLQQAGADGDVILNDLHLTVAVPRVLAHPAHLVSLVEQGVAAVESLVPHVPWGGAGGG